MEFVDSNVLLYAYDESAGVRREQAETLLIRLATARQGAVSIQVFQEFYVNATRKLERPMPRSEAREVLRSLSRWSVHSPVAADVLAATVIGEENTISFWDAMIVRSAAQLGCSTLWSEDLNDGQTISGVLVRNPFSGG